MSAAATASSAGSAKFGMRLKPDLIQDRIAFELSGVMGKSEVPPTVRCGATTVTLKYTPSNTELLIDPVSIKNAMESDRLKADVVQMIRATFVMNEARAAVELHAAHTRLRIASPQVHKLLSTPGTAVSPVLTPLKPDSLIVKTLKRVRSTFFGAEDVVFKHPESDTAKKEAEDDSAEDPNPRSKKRLKTQAEKDIKLGSDPEECLRIKGFSHQEFQLFLPVVKLLHKLNGESTPKDVHCDALRVSPDEVQFTVKNYERMHFSDCAKIYEEAKTCGPQWTTRVFWDFRHKHFQVVMVKVPASPVSTANASASASTNNLSDSHFLPF